MEKTDTVDIIEGDTTCTSSPYFTIHEGKMEEWKEIAKRFYELAKTEKDIIHYGFTYSEDGQVHCRIAYKSGAALLHHLEVVDELHKSTLKNGTMSNLTRLEFHGPKSEIEVVREALTPFGCIFFSADKNCFKNNPFYKS